MTPNLDSTTTPFVQHRLDAYADAVWRKDVDAFLASYDPAVRIFDLWDRWSFDGLEAWRGSVAGWFGSLGEERVRVTFSDVHCVDSPTLVVITGFIRYAAVMPDGTSPRALENRFTWVLATDGDAVRIVHEHTSAPIAGETTKAMFRR
jgi:ketosteroid isomerase-like protein